MIHAATDEVLERLWYATEEARTPIAFADLEHSPRRERRRSRHRAQYADHERLRSDRSRYGLHAFRRPPRA